MWCHLAVDISWIFIGQKCTVAITRLFLVGSFRRKKESCSTQLTQKDGDMWCHLAVDISWIPIGRKCTVAIARQI